jgi:hypothetical protein
MRECAGNVPRGKPISSPIEIVGDVSEMQPAERAPLALIVRGVGTPGVRDWSGHLLGHRSRWSSSLRADRQADRGHRRCACTAIYTAIVLVGPIAIAVVGTVISKGGTARRSLYRARVRGSAHVPRSGGRARSEGQPDRAAQPAWWSNEEFRRSQHRWVVAGLIVYGLFALLLIIGAYA